MVLDTITRGQRLIRPSPTRRLDSSILSNKRGPSKEGPLSLPHPIALLLIRADRLFDTLEQVVRHVFQTAGRSRIGAKQQAGDHPEEDAEIKQDGHPVQAGEPGPDGKFPEGTINRAVDDRLRQYTKSFKELGSKEQEKETEKEKEKEAPPEGA